VASLAPLAKPAQKFERFLETYRRPDGRKWSGKDLREATGGVVSSSYVTHLRKGRIENPGYEKLKAIAEAMGFPPELWFEDAATNLGDVSSTRPSWFLDREDKLTLLDEEVVEALQDGTQPETSTPKPRRSWRWPRS
jgi:transcriptional regulator with XRE-family HTH domain